MNKVRNRAPRKAQQGGIWLATTLQQSEMHIANQQTTRAHKKAKRAQMRKIALKQPRGQSRLEAAAVSQSCLNRYTSHWQILKPLVTNSVGKLKRRPHAVDKAMSQHLDSMYMDGEDISTAQYAVAALMHFNPGLRSTNMVVLPHARQSLKGWRKMAPNRSRLPVPWEVTALVATHAIICFALHMLPMFALYLRPSEALRIRCCDVSRPNRRGSAAYQNWTVVLHPQEEGLPSKTREFDECLQLYRSAISSRDWSFDETLHESAAVLLKTNDSDPREFRPSVMKNLQPQTGPGQNSLFSFSHFGYHYIHHFLKIFYHPPWNIL